MSKLPKLFKTHHAAQIAAQNVRKNFNSVIVYAAGDGYRVAYGSPKTPAQRATGGRHQ